MPTSFRFDSLQKSVQETKRKLQIVQGLPKNGFIDNINSNKWIIPTSIAAALLLTFRNSNKKLINPEYNQILDVEKYSLKITRINNLCNQLARDNFDSKKKAISKLSKYLLEDNTKIRNLERNKIIQAILLEANIPVQTFDNQFQINTEILDNLKYAAQKEPLNYQFIALAIKNLQDNNSSSEYFDLYQHILDSITNRSKYQDSILNKFLWSLPIIGVGVTIASLIYSNLNKNE